MILCIKLARASFIIITRVTAINSWAGIVLKQVGSQPPQVAVIIVL